MGKSMDSAVTLDLQQVIEGAAHDLAIMMKCHASANPDWWNRNCGFCGGTGEKYDDDAEQWTGNKCECCNGFGEH